MSNSRYTAAIAPARHTLASPLSSIAVDWMAAALSQMEAPLPQAGSPLAIGMFNSLVSFQRYDYPFSYSRLLYKFDYYNNNNELKRYLIFL